MVPPMGTAAGTTTVAGAAAAKSANAKNEKSPANPLNIVIVNPDYNKVHWEVYKAHCVPTRKVVVGRLTTIHTQWTRTTPW